MEWEGGGGRGGREGGKLNHVIGCLVVRCYSLLVEGEVSFGYECVWMGR